MADHSNKEPWLVSGAILSVALAAGVLLTVRNPLRPVAAQPPPARRAPKPPRFPKRPAPPAVWPKKPDDLLPMPRLETVEEADEVLPPPRKREK